MAYCYECGSEVAQIDVFCPYCGITLKPANLADESADEILSSAPDEVSAPQPTSVIAEPLVESAAPTQVKEPKTETDFALIEMEESVNLPDEIKGKIKSETPFESTETPVLLKETEVIAPSTVPIANDFSEIPPPAMIENFASFSAVSDKREAVQTPESAPTETENFGLAETAEVETIKEKDIFPAQQNSEFALEANKKAEVSAPETFAIETETPVKFNSLVEIDESTNIKNESPENSVEEPSLNAITEDDFSATIPDIVLLQTATAENDEVAQMSSDSSEEIVEESENKAVVEESITKPDDELKAFEPNSAPLIFDSVRIMEGTDSHGNPPQTEAKNIAPIVNTAEPIVQENPVADTSSGQVAMSHTTPNIGGSDTDGKKAAKLRPLDEGTILNNRYEIIRKIGGGGMGAVYLASDNNLGGVLRAVKEMVQSYIEEEQQEKSVNDFKRESTILSTLDHSSIPTIYDYFFDEKESRFYLVMKYINGGDLSGRLRAAPEGKIDEKTVTDWSIQIADVLDYLHNRPNTIVYRDLKPANVMLDGNSGRIMLIDFGIARSINKEEKGVTAVGTMGYAPPELFSGNVEARSDIYSLGSTMFHLLTGADPQNNPLLIFDFQKNPRPRQINPQLSDQMERILMCAVEYNSTARFASAKELKKTLVEHLENLNAGKVTYGIKKVPQAVSLANQLVFCGFCGQKIVASDIFCAFCGSKQPLSQQGVHAEIYASAPQTAKLMILGTNELESPIFNLEKDENFVGRRDPQSGIFPEVDLSKFDPQTKISRRHARIWRDGGNFMVEDLGSSNGTTVLPSVNDVVRLLPHQPHILASGDKIRIGDTTLHFVRG